MRQITYKDVQIHFECVCGYNSVYQQKIKIKWSDLRKGGITRKKDRDTGKIFLLANEFSGTCFCNE